MNNYSKYCEDCQKFFSTTKTQFKRREESYAGNLFEDLCPTCGEPLGAITCYWMLVVGHHCNGEYVRQRCVKLDILIKMCYNCDNRFKCWTESL